MGQPVRILVLGAGAVGLPLAAKLSRVADVTALTREPYARAVSARGLQIRGAWGNDTARFSCITEIPDGAGYDYILITSKSQDTETLCRQYGRLFGGAEVVSFQNGIGNEETIARFADRVIGGVVLSGFVRDGDREVCVTANAGPMQLGRFPEGLDAGVTRLADLMHRAGIPVEATARIRDQIWSKNLINCCLNPLSAISGVSYGELKRPDSWHIIEGMTREIFAVVRGEKVCLPWGDPGAYLGYLHGALIPVMAGHRSSMLQDIAHGRKTEIDYLNGAVVRAGEALGIPTPVNACVTDMVRFIESLHAPAH